MSGRTPKALRELMPIARAYQLEFVGVTGKGHYKWRHIPTGRTLNSVSSHTSWSSIKNTERDWRRRIQQFTGEANGQHHHSH